MKGLLFSICALLLILAICSTCCGQPKAKAAPVKPAKTLVRQAPSATPTKVVQKAPAVTMPAAPAESTQPAPAIVTPAPASVGTGPSVPSVPAVGSPGTTMTVDGDFVYILQDGKVFRLAKSDVNSCGTPVPVCPSGAGPCPTCQGMTYIPGFASTTCTVTTSTPCPPPCPSPCPAATGAGPCATPCPNSCQPPPCPTTIVRCTPNIPQTCNPESPCEAVSCNQCNPTAQPTIVSNTCTTPCGSGAGPSACPPIAVVSACTQVTIDAMQTLCGADVDRAYLQAMIQLNMQVMALSDAAVVNLGTTRLQDYATNSIADSRSRISQAESWLRSKFCLTVAACPPGSIGQTVCDMLCADKSGAAFDAAYKKQLVQWYVDEIALSQVEIDRGLDCQVKAYAAEVIRQNQARIERLHRCGVCI